MRLDRIAGRQHSLSWISTNHQHPDCSRLFKDEVPLMCEPSLLAKACGQTARRRLRYLLGLLLWLPGMLIGCASITNPVADGIPARFLPPETFGESKELYKQVPE